MLITDVVEDQLAGVEAFLLSLAVTFYGMALSGCCGVYLGSNGVCRGAVGGVGFMLRSGGTQ